MTRQVIITCAITGSAAINPKHPSFPITPKEIAESAIGATKAGATSVHIHVRDPETGLPVPSRNYNNTEPGEAVTYQIYLEADFHALRLDLDL